MVLVSRSLLNPGGGDVGTGSEDVDAVAIVGEAGATVGAIGGSHGGGLRDRDQNDTPC